MKNWNVYISLLLAMAMMACRQEPKKLNERVTLWRKDKIPYGTYYAFENLKWLFPKAVVQINHISPAEYKFSNPENLYPVREELKGKLRTTDEKKRSAYIIIAPEVIPDQREINALLNFVGEGNQVFISAFYMGDSLLNSLKLKIDHPVWPFRQRLLRVSVYNPFSYESLSFQYPGLPADNAISQMDSQYTTILGRNETGIANFVRFTYKGGGGLYLHFAPMALTNFFLLHKENKAYYDNVFSYLPASITEIKWDDYFRYPRSRNFSALQFIMANQSLRWAFWLILLLFLFIYLFESKRRQRLIPAKAAVRNSSLDFVKTIGRLYYQRKDNGNLALKMTTHFLDHVRTKYNLPTASLDDDFVDRLSYKSGFSREGLAGLVGLIRTFQLDPYLTDEQLLQFNKKIEEFYKQA